MVRFRHAGQLAGQAPGRFERTAWDRPGGGGGVMDYGSGRDLTSKRERAELLLAALAVLLIRGGEHVGLYGADQTATGGRATLNRLVANLEAQAAVGPASEGLPAITRLPRFCHLVLIGDFLSPLAEVETTLRTFSTQGARGHLVQILDPAEEDLPFHGRTEFDGTENEGQLLVGRVESLRDAYVRRMATREIVRRLYPASFSR